MKTHATIAIIFLLLCPAMICPSGASSFYAEVQPSEISPGSAFLLRVTGTVETPEAEMDKSALIFSRCGNDCFIAIGAVEIDAEAGEHPIYLKAAGETSILPLSVKTASFPAISLTLPDSKVFLNEDDLRRAKSEEKRLQAIWQKKSERLWQGSFILPLQHETSTSFGTVRLINGKRKSIHKGMDIRAIEGDEIRASNEGKVVLAEDLFFGGNTLVLDHGLGIYTIYMHLSSFAVTVGDTVSKGDVIGFAGSTGRASGPHLHFSVKVDTVSTDPLSLISLRP